MATYLEDMFEGVRNLVPFVDQVFVAFSHHQIEILVLLSGNNSIMDDALLVLSHSAPAVSMECIEKCKTRPVKPGVYIYGSSWQQHDLDLQGGFVGGNITESEVGDGWMIIRQRMLRVMYWRKN